MRWVDALKIWNAEKGGAWCVPRKGTPEHAIVKSIMAGKKPEPVVEKKKRKIRIVEEEEEAPTIVIKKKKKIRVAEEEPPVVSAAAPAPAPAPVGGAGAPSSNVILKEYKKAYADLLNISDNFTASQIERDGRFYEVSGIPKPRAVVSLMNDRGVDITYEKFTDTFSDWKRSQDKLKPGDRFKFYKPKLIAYLEKRIDAYKSKIERGMNVTLNKMRLNYYEKQLKNTIESKLVVSGTKFGSIIMEMESAGFFF